MTPEPDLAGKVAVITGGGAGIGRAFAEAVATRGGHVAILDIDPATATVAADELHAHGGQAIAVPCDVGDEPSCAAAIDEVVRELGRIDVLVNNAAKHLMAWNVPILQLDDKRWRSLVDVNVHGIVNVTRHARPWLARQGGVVVSISSVVGFESSNAYAFTKHAVRGLTVAFAVELASEGIRAFAIAPGPMDTQAAKVELPADILDSYINDKQLIKRQGTPADLVGAFLFFCSDAASFMTGETVSIGGGFPLRP
ncbi:MAG TPA: SDR family oxidoreductase [Acidimicrobiales bacterium]|jgi:NAD(P)-dependent dehydrogenase (short-subunit alcohol dehydrogenase family)|nr:SDR family oxidoreductase [Acidimicrobiales bacterium]